MHDYELLRRRPTDKGDHDDEEDEDGGGRIRATSTFSQQGALNQQPSCRTRTKKQEKFIG